MLQIHSACRFQMKREKMRRDEARREEKHRKKLPLKSNTGYLDYVVKCKLSQSKKARNKYTHNNCWILNWCFRSGGRVEEKRACDQMQAVLLLSLPLKISRFLRLCWLWSSQKMWEGNLSNPQTEDKTLYRRNSRPVQFFTEKVDISIKSTPNWRKVSDEFKSIW